MRRMRPSDLPQLHIDNADDTQDSMPPVPKRRRCNGTKAERLAAFSLAARASSGSEKRVSAAIRIQATTRGYRQRAYLRLLRPTSAPSSEEGNAEEIPEEIEEDKEHDVVSEFSALRMASAMGAEVDCALECSGDLDRSFDSSPPNVPSMMPTASPSTVQQHADRRTCAICLGEMRKRNSAEASSPSLAPLPLTVATLECGHKFHRKCLLKCAPTATSNPLALQRRLSPPLACLLPNTAAPSSPAHTLTASRCTRCFSTGCRERPPGDCPLCRVSVQVRRRIDSGSEGQ